MQSGKIFERLAQARLPAILGDLLDTDVAAPMLQVEPERGIDIRVAAGGRRWEFVLKSPGGPAQVRRAAAIIRETADDDLRVLVVPHMSKAAADAADELGVNWIDLAGNAHIRDEGLYVWVFGRPAVVETRGRPSSPFAVRSARVTRQLLIDPGRWWRQTDLADVADLDAGTVSRVVRRLSDLGLVERRDRAVRPADPGELLDAWAREYRFDHHDAVTVQFSGDGVDVTHELAGRFAEASVRHAFTGFSAAWMLDPFTRFRTVSVFVDGDPRAVAADLALRTIATGGNVELIGPRDAGVFQGATVTDGVHCVSTPQAYLDLQHLPERSAEAAERMRRRVVSR